MWPELTSDFERTHRCVFLGSTMLVFIVIAQFLLGELRFFSGSVSLLLYGHVRGG